MCTLSANWSKICGVFKWPSQIKVSSVAHFFEQNIKVGVHVPYAVGTISDISLKPFIFGFINFRLARNDPYPQNRNWYVLWTNIIFLPKFSRNVGISGMIEFNNGMIILNYSSLQFYVVNLIVLECFNLWSHCQIGWFLACLLIQEQLLVNVKYQMTYIYVQYFC